MQKVFKVPSVSLADIPVVLGFIHPGFTITIDSKCESALLAGHVE